MRRVALVSWLVLVLAALGTGVCAAVIRNQSIHDAGRSRDVGGLPPAEVFPLAAGRVVAVDPKDGKITVAHAAIPRFYMERMTRIFPVEDRTLLVGLTPGDKIRFDLERRAGHYVITHIENSN
ncbi:MAG: copper-binding protein [Proteobacteria bacterium]|nr:copper-binding protein [Pseudomonadota bacterium]